MKVTLIKSDIRKAGSFDFLLMGHRNPILQEFRKETKVSFQKIEAPGAYPHNWFLAEGITAEWNVLAYINFRSHPNFSERNSSRITDTLIHALKYKQAKRIAILPLSWRNPEYVATITIYSLWLLNHAVNQPYGKERFGDPENSSFCIITNDSLAPYLRVLENEMSIMWNFVEELIKKGNFICAPPRLSELKESRISYEVAREYSIE